MSISERGANLTVFEGVKLGRGARRGVTMGGWRFGKRNAGGSEEGAGI